MGGGGGGRVARREVVAHCLISTQFDIICSKGSAVIFRFFFAYKEQYQQKVN